MGFISGCLTSGPMELISLPERENPCRFFNPYNCVLNPEIGNQTLYDNQPILARYGKRIFSNEIMYP